ncbi:MAG: sigma factor [Planctomycetota bacterium]|nr:sigma factor [Planctomycetota bacterium]
MFPTTIWTQILQAGADDETALEEFARSYRRPVLEYIRSRGFQDGDAEDLCQEVFVCVFQGGVLRKADRSRGRFRSLLRSVTVHVLQDKLRKRGELPVEDLEPSASDPEFDEAWALHLTERALVRLKDQGSPYYGVLRGHIAGEPQDRNKLWIARRKLAENIRREVATTCFSQEDFEAEMTFLAPYLQSPGKE